MKPAPIDARVHSEDEVSHFLAHIHAWQAEKPAYLPAYALEMQMLMGLRRGEVPPLRWSDVKDGYVLISREQITVKRNGCDQRF